MDREKNMLNNDSDLICVDRKFFSDLVNALNQWKSGEELDAAFIFKLTRLTNEANRNL